MASTYASTNETNNYCRLCRIYVDVLRDCLWGVVQTKIPTTDLLTKLKAYLNAYKGPLKPFHHQLTDLCKLPRDPVNTDFDISLLYSIVRNLCKLPPPAKGWNKFPASVDLAVADDVERIRFGRNALYGHCTQAAVSDFDYQTEVQNIQQTVLRLDTYLNSNLSQELNTILTDFIDPETALVYQQYTTDLEEQRQRDEQLQAKIEQNKTGLKDIQGRISNVEKEIGGMREKERMKDRQLVVDEAGLRNYLLQYYKREISTIKMSKFCDAVNVLDLFAPLVIREDIERWLSKKERETGEIDTRSKDEEQARIGSYDEIFYKDKKMQHEIYLLGEAGIGKSTFCLQIINLWCQMQTNDPKSQYEQILKDMDFIFYLRCRHAKKTQSVLEMIYDQVCPLRYRAVLEMLLSNRPEKCMIVIDGLDEWNASSTEESSTVSSNGLPDSKDVYGSVVLTTSRPWRIEALEYHLTRSCRVLEIQGLDADYVESLSLKVMKALGVPNVKEAAENFLRQIKQKGLEDITTVPLMLIIIVTTWHMYGQKILRSRCMNYCGLIESVIKHSEQKSQGKHSGKWRSQAGTQLPKCFEGMELCSKYALLIGTLAELAFNTLLGHTKENTLVFEKEELVNQLGEEALQVSLDLGLLSESKTFSDSVVSNVSISFLHKSVQEFLAALYFCGEEFQNCLSTFCTRVASLTDLFEVELVLVFLSGFAPDKGMLVSNHMTNVAESSQMVLDYRRSDILDNDNPQFYHNAACLRNVELFQHLILQCASESNHFLEATASRSLFSRLKSSIRKDTGPQFFIRDIIIDRMANIDTTRFLKFPVSKLKSMVCIDVITPEEIMASLGSMKQIEKLGICMAEAIADKYIRHVYRSLSKLPHLEAFYLSSFDVSFPSRISCDLLFKALLKVQTLRSVYLFRTNLSGMTALSLPPQCRSIYLNRLSIPSRFMLPPQCQRLQLFKVRSLPSQLNLPATLQSVTLSNMTVTKETLSALPTSLTFLKLDLITLSKSGWDQVVQYLEGSSSLEVLVLCPSFRPRISITAPVNVQSHQRLHSLTLCDLELKSGLMIPQSYSLKDVFLNSVKMSSERWRSFIQSLPKSHSITIRLCYVNLDDETVADICKNFTVAVNNDNSDSDDTDNDSTKDDETEKDGTKDGDTEKDGIKGDETEEDSIKGDVTNNDGIVGKDTDNDSTACIITNNGSIDMTKDDANDSNMDSDDAESDDADSDDSSNDGDKFIVFYTNVEAGSC